MEPRPDIPVDELLAQVHRRLGGLGIDMQTFGETGTVEIRWKRSYDGVSSDERFTSAESLVDALWQVLDTEAEADQHDADELAADVHAG
jgi:hypothetical protein